MKEKYKSMVVIPARGGSKRLPRKNLLELSGKPLISHSIEAAVKCGCFEKIIVSTDDQEIAVIAKDYSNVTVDERNPVLAGDEIKVWNVITDICRRDEIKNAYDIVALMLPTAPFRRADTLHKAFNMLTTETDSVVSFTECEFPPQMSVSFDDEMNMRPLFESSPLITGDTRSQDQKQAYRPNGSIYLSWIKSFLRSNSFYKGNVKGVLMNRFGSIDIDRQEDLEIARLMIKAGIANSDFI